MAYAGKIAHTHNNQKQNFNL